MGAVQASTGDTVELPEMSETPGVSENTTAFTHVVVGELVVEEGECRRLLDIPCGAGAFTRRMTVQGYDVVAADCQNILQFRYDNFARADMNARLEFADSSFDAVVCIDGIEHIERPFDFIGEVARILRPGGVFVVSTPNLHSLRSRWRWMLTGFHHGEKLPLDEHNPTPLHHISLVSFSDLRYRLHTRGFRITRLRTNRYRLIGLIYGIFAPVSYLMTRWVFYKEGQRRSDKATLREILGQLFSPALMFGDTLIIKSVCEKTAD